jgi:hypothetical protein
VRILPQISERSKAILKIDIPLLNSLSKPPNILVLTGLAVSIVGCFLPWAEFRWSFNQLVAYPETEIGMQLTLGTFHSLVARLQHSSNWFTKQEKEQDSPLPLY